MYNLEGKVALVTGAAGKRGLGHAIALRLAQEGADVAVSDVSRFDVRLSKEDGIEGWRGLEDVVLEIKSMGRRAVAIEADLTYSQQAEGLITKCISELGKVDILVNNAGIRGPVRVPAVEVPTEEWKRVLDINLTGPYVCVKAVAKHMIERQEGGKIINISSVAAKLARPGFVSYYASKSGVLSLTRVLAVELARYKIYVNAVCPGFISTDIYMDDDARSHVRSDIRSGMTLEEANARSFADLFPQIPLGRLGKPEEIANMVAFLASRESDYITGQAINVCGGFLMD